MVLKSIPYIFSPTFQPLLIQTLFAAQIGRSNRKNNSITYGIGNPLLRPNNYFVKNPLKLLITLVLLPDFTGVESNLLIIFVRIKNNLYERGKEEQIFG